jgi:hypothetical protein
MLLLLLFRMPPALIAHMLHDGCCCAELIHMAAVVAQS